MTTPQIMPNLVMNLKNSYDEKNTDCIIGPYIDHGL